MTKQLSLNETNYIVGIDLNSHEAIVSYIDQKSLEPIIYDMSGGYGQSAIPLAMLYILEEKDWLIGDPIFLNKSQEGTLFIGQLLNLVLQRDLITVDDHQYTSEEILVIFINKILESFYQINPKAKIIDLTISFPDHIFDDIEKIFKPNFELLNQQPFNLQLIPTTKALIKYLQYNKVAFKHKTVVLYYEYGQFRTAYIKKDNDEIEIVPDKMNESLSIVVIENAIKEKITNIYLEHVKKEFLSPEDERNLLELIHHQLSWVFQKYGLKQSMKIYFNFAYPPFQKTFSFNQLEELILPFEKKLRDFLNNYLLENDQVILIGAGYKMQWPTIIVNEFVKPIEINPIDSIAKGCCLFAAGEIIPLPEWSVKYISAHRHIGIMVNNKNEDPFIPLTEGSNVLIIDFEGSDSLKLPIYYRDPSTKLLTVEYEVILEKKSNDTILRINLQLAYIEDNIQIDIEYLPL